MVKDEEEKERKANKEEKATTPRTELRRGFVFDEKEYFNAGEMTQRE